MKSIAWNDEKLDSLISQLSSMVPCGRTGIKSLDDMLGGGLYPEIYVLAAEPGAGKTTLALQIADRIAEFGSRKALFVSLEMSASQMLAKSLSRISALSPSLPPLTVRQLMNARQLSNDGKQAMMEALIAYREQTAPNIATVDERVTVADLRKLYESLPSAEFPPLLVIDYLQLLPPSDGDPSATDYQTHTANMRGLCELAKTYKTPVLVISSKNRVNRNGRQLASLSGSSEIEYSASCVLFLDIDGDTEDERAEEAARSKRLVTLSVRKNRFGTCGEVPLVFLANESRFIERCTH
ncbi:DnaB-like helicase C-terminal domain-containing protein [Paraeggerthella sp.]|uniref:DnaB-like helicase C-terminal domain-containing protein n=1 Tax=Paraeggerthella sp. TaxID=2897350 RepID=UPI003AB71397